MPIGHIVKDPSADADKLIQILKKEWMGISNSLDHEPVLIEEPSGMGDYKRLYVIWSKWSGMSHRERAEIILKSYRQARPADSLNVTVATGLTKKEAADMNLKYTMGKNEEHE